MTTFIRQDGTYYEGDREHALDIEVPERPTALHTWDGQQWVLTDAAAKEAHNAPILAQLAQIDADNPITQRKLRELTMLLSQTIKAVAVAAGAPQLDPTALPGYATVLTVEAQAATLRAQLQK